LIRRRRPLLNLNTSSEFMQGEMILFLAQFRYIWYIWNTKEQLLLFFVPFLWEKYTKKCPFEWPLSNCKIFIFSWTTKVQKDFIQICLYIMKIDSLRDRVRVDHHRQTTNTNKNLHLHWQKSYSLIVRPHKMVASQISVNKPSQFS